MPCVFATIKDGGYHAFLASLVCLFRHLTLRAIFYIIVQKIVIFFHEWHLENFASRKRQKFAKSRKLIGKKNKKKSKIKLTNWRIFPSFDISESGEKADISLSRWPCRLFWHQPSDQLLDYIPQLVGTFVAFQSQDPKSQVQVETRSLKLFDSKHRNSRKKNNCGFNVSGNFPFMANYFVQFH